MAKARFNSVDEYIAAQPEPVQDVLERVRRAVRKAVPGAEEGISYQMPTCKLHGRPVIYIAAWKRHYSVYPATRRVVTELQHELAPYAVSKGTIRFLFTEPVPAKLIERIARLRAKEVAEGDAKRTGTAQSRPRPARRTARSPGDRRAPSRQ